MTVLAVDLGGTQMRAAHVAPDGKVSDKTVRRTPHDQERPEGFVALLKGMGPAERAVVGLPGRIDHRNGLLDHAPHLPQTWAPHLSEERLADALGFPVHLANDADLAAVGEAYFGAAMGFSDVCFLTLSTGIGAGVLLDRKLVRGRWSSAEVGHTIIDLGAAERGEPAAFESFASGTALGRLGALAGIEGGGKEVVERVRAGDPIALAVWRKVTFAASVGIANVAYCWSPEIIVLGGGLGLAGDILYGPIRDYLRRRGPPGFAEPIQVVGAALGDEAGLVGAAAWARAT
jgi:glucokinase